MQSVRVVTIASWVAIFGFNTAASGKTMSAKKTSEPTLEFWSRQNGSHSDDAIRTKELYKKISLSSFKTEKRTLKDEQYHRSETFLGIPLATLVKSFKPKIQDDTVILHFANGMAVPLPIEDDVLSKVNAFVALQICPGNKVCSPNFPPVSRDEAYSVMSDPVPIHFKGNKLVISSPWHPLVPESRSRIFSPWRHVDSLTGLEFVNGDKYRGQFVLGEPVGEKVFFERCQFCHGVRHVGASFGWDVVTPLPLHQKRTPETLLNHVKYPKIQAKEMGISMPTQSDVTPSEMQAVWSWMALAVKQKVKNY